jgi:flagellar protein FlaG
MPAALPQKRESTAVVSSPADGGINASAQGVAVAEGSGSAQTPVVHGIHSGGTDPELAAAIDQLNSKVQNLNRNLEFSLDKDSGELLVKVVDAKTHEVISQIPRKEALQLARNIELYLQEHHIGLVQTKA